MSLKVKIPIGEIIITIILIIVFFSTPDTEITRNIVIGIILIYIWLSGIEVTIES